MKLLCLNSKIRGSHRERTRQPARTERYVRAGQLVGQEDAEKRKRKIKPRKITEVKAKDRHEFHGLTRKEKKALFTALRTRRRRERKEELKIWDKSYSHTPAKKLSRMNPCPTSGRRATCILAGTGTGPGRNEK